MIKSKDSIITLLKTSNLGLSFFNLNDLFDLRSNDHVVKFVEKEADKSKEDTKKLIQKLRYQFKEVENGRLI